MLSLHPIVNPPSNSLAYLSSLLVVVSDSNICYKCLSFDTINLCFILSSYIANEMDPS